MSTSRIEDKLNKVEKNLPGVQGPLPAAKEEKDFTNFADRTVAEKAALIGFWIGIGIGAAAILALLVFGVVLPTLGILIPSIVVNLCQSISTLNTCGTFFIFGWSMNDKNERSSPTRILPLVLIVGPIGLGLGRLGAIIGKRIADLFTSEKVISTTNTAEKQPLLNIAPSIEPAAPADKIAQRPVIEEDLELEQDESLRHSMS